MAALARDSRDGLFYFPTNYPTGFWEPESYGLKVEDCYFPTEDGLTLHSWLALSPGADTCILWSHGNAGNLSDRLENIIRMVAIGVNVFIYDYRGYGRSEGRPEEEGLYRDGRAAYDYLTSLPGVEPGRLFLFGRALGGAVALDTALTRPLAGLILESTFTSGKELFAHWYPGAAPGLLEGFRFPSVSKIAKLSAPMLMIHGAYDERIPIKHGLKLLAAASGPKEFYRIDRAGHNDTYFIGGQAYFDRIAAFIREHSAGIGANGSR
ncbi:MAG: alpha/beta hydrolase [Dehalococcoidia bacterium]|nr:alpha/beta hydrolase [Dehalococcoidia bacterium]